VRDMQAAGHAVVESNPFEDHVPVLGKTKRIVSPYAGRIEAMWNQMRGVVISVFPKPKEIESSEEKKVIRIIKDLYTQDAYHSLSIEGYEVTEELIQKIADGKWSPETDPKDREEKNAMAAKGYHDAFQKVVESVSKVMQGADAAKVFESDLQNWYRALFSPLVQVNMLKASDLAGYRNGPVYIKGARHVPPGKDGVLDSMETLFRLLKEEEHPAVRAVLGHFIFVYIHPYMDGNGRIARFILNLMLISGGYAWTVIRTAGRPEYMTSLESASTEGKIEPFAKFIRSELDYWEKRAKNAKD
jgi:Fic family protein